MRIRINDLIARKDAKSQRKQKIFISNTVEHIAIMEEKDLVHIEKVSDDTFIALKLSRFWDNTMCSLSLLLL